MDRTEDLQKRIRELEQENLRLQDTVSWMHDLIWDLIKQLKGGSGT